MATASSVKLLGQQVAPMGNNRRSMVFCLSMGDVFDNEVPDEWRWNRKAEKTGKRLKVFCMLIRLTHTGARD